MSVGTLWDLLAANSIFSISLKAAYTYVSWTSNFYRILQIENIFISCDICNWFRFIFSWLKAWKLIHCYLNCHELLIDILIDTYLWFIIWLRRSFKLWHCFLWLRDLVIIRLIRLWACKFMIYTWLYKGHGGLKVFI